MASTKAFATLLDIDVPDNQKRDQSRTIYTDATIPNQENNLADWLIGLEIENTGISKVNSGEITLRIDERGTFVRDNPILVNEDAKNKYMIEIQLKQDLDSDDDFNDPSEQGIVLRGLIGQPSVIQNSSYGEILRIPLISVQYRLNEMISSRWFLFKSPKDSFGDRVAEIGLTPNNYPIRDNIVTNNLPTSPLLSYKPTGPKSIHDSMGEIITDLANPQVEGGAFDDYYFEIENDPNHTNYLNITAEKFGLTDSGVVIDPLSFDVEDTGEENTTITDNMSYKNHAILIGDTKAGSLPMERARFASNYQHAKIRDEWDSGVTYQSGDLVKVITTATHKPHLITYHRALTDGNTGNDPISTHGTNWEIDFTDIPPFVTASDAYYKVGEIVSHESGGTIYFYQCDEEQSYTTTHFSSSSPPTPPSGWNFITSTSSTFYEPFVSYSPWTNDVDIWKQTLAGRGKGKATANFNPTVDGNLYEGWAWDWNVTKSNFNRKNLQSSFEEISPKVISGFTSQYGITGDNNVPNKEKYDSNRFLIDTASGEPWASNLNKIVEYDASTGTWQYSNQAVSGDTIINLFDGKVWKYNGSIWEAKWDWTNSENTDKPTPFHAVKNVGLVAGATGIAGQAVEFDYDWHVTPGDDHVNRTSRGVWLCSTALLPRHDTNQYDVGELYGGTPSGGSGSLGTIDTNNYDFDRNGLQGWNKGLDDEDYGRISALAFKMRVGFFRTREGGGLIHGIPDIPMTFWAIDKFDRVWFHRFKLTRNGEWDDVTVPIGELAPTSLHYARWDELAVFFDGVPITGLDFTIKEREFSGVAFDWKYVKYWGVQLNESYTSVGLYKNGLERAFEYGEDLLADLAGNIWYQGGALIYNTIGYVTALATGNDFQAIPATQNFIRESARIAIDDLHFEKELLVTSSDTSVQNARTDVQYVGNEVDYVNLKTRAKARVARKKFFPQTAHIRTSGDVRLRFGQAFKVSGSRVIENPDNYPAYNALNTYSVGDKVSHGGYTYQALQNVPVNTIPPNNAYWENLNKYVVSNVKHKFNHDGYFCEVAGFRKFVVSG